MLPLTGSILLCCLAAPQAPDRSASEAVEAVETDRLSVELAPEVLGAVEDAPAGARLILLLADERTDPGIEPIDLVDPMLPQPVASWALDGPEVRLDAASGRLHCGAPDRAHPLPPTALDGTFRAQLVLDLPGNGNGPWGPGDLSGPVRTLELEATSGSEHRLVLDRVLAGAEPPEERPWLHRLRRPTDLIPARRGVPREQRGWVVLPRGYDDLQARRRFWPVIYLVPDRDSPEATAARLAELSRRRELSAVLPGAIWVVLDPRGAHGHHHFTDSPVNGARGRALVEELIPWIDARYRTVAEPEARILLGEGAGGRTVLELLTAHPEFFGRAWSIAPEGVSFGHVGTVDLYRDANGFEDGTGGLRIARRTPLGSERDLVNATIRDEIRTGETLGPEGRGGTSWDAWRAAFGRPTRDGRFPPGPIDPDTGTIDPLVAADWSAADLLLRARRDPECAERLRERARIIVGGRDERYRHLGIEALALELGVDVTRPESAVHVVPEATNETVSPRGRVRAWEEIIDHLRGRDLID